MKKVCTLVLALVLVLALSAGALAADSHLHRILESGKIRVAMIPENPGWSVMDADGNWVGYDVEIAKMLAEALGVDQSTISRKLKKRD